MSSSVSLRTLRRIDSSLFFSLVTQNCFTARPTAGLPMGSLHPFHSLVVCGRKSGRASEATERQLVLMADGSQLLLTSH